MPSPLDIGATYLTPSWRGINFVVTTWRWGFDQDHAQHKYPDRDSARIEATGRNPASYTFTALFRRGLSGEGSEIYPNRWRSFVSACMDRSTGKLVHPELGEVNAKCRSCTTSFDPARRDGVDVEVEFVEASTNEDELAGLLAGASPTAAAFAAAVDLDNAIGDVSPVPEYPEALKPSALESMRALSGLVQQFQMGLGNISASLDQYAGAVDELRETIEGADNPANYAAVEACYRLFDSVYRLAETISRKARPFGPVRTSADAAIGLIGSFFGMSTGEFLSLNPLLAAVSVVPAKTLVFVYL